MLNRQLALFCLLGTALTGCSTMRPPGTETILAKPTASSMATSPTATTPGTPPIQDSLTRCVNSDHPSVMTSEFEFPGVISIESEFKVIVLGGSVSQERIAINLSHDDWSIGMSPNGKWFAYGSFPSPNGAPDSIHLLSMNGQVISQKAPPPPFDLSQSGQGGWTSTRWINDELMLVYIYNGTEENPRRFFAAVFDPFTGSWHQSVIDQLAERNDQGGLAFSPDMTRVLYVSGKGSEYSLVLWDLIEHQELWRRDDFGNQAIIEGTRVGNIPIAWSKDSTKVALVDWVPGPDGLEGKIYVLDRDGKQMGLLNSSRRDNAAYGLSWSPDGRYLAAVAGLTLDSTQSAILVYDTLTNRETEVCPIEKESNPLNSVQTGALVWSPDSHYVAYGLGTDPLSDDNAIAALDLFTGEIIVIKRGPRTTLLGWTTIEDWLQP